MFVRCRDQRSLWLGLIGLLAIALCAGDSSVGQEPGKAKDSPARAFKPNVSPKNGGNANASKAAPSKDDKLPSFSLEREAAALSFVRQHHPELADLLAQLKAGNRKEYQRVVHELFRTSERLAASRERDPVKYELELSDWKLDSRIRLLAARMMMSDSLAESQEELKQLLLERTDVQLEQQLLERQRITTRLEKLDAAIEKTRGAREAQAQESLDKLLKGIQDSRPNRQPRGKSPTTGAATSELNKAATGAAK